MVAGAFPDEFEEHPPIRRPPAPEEPTWRGALGARLSALLLELDHFAHDGREKSLVRTKLEEAELWLQRVRMRDDS